jgi:hypothetical protein
MWERLEVKRLIGWTRKEKLCESTWAQSVAEQDMWTEFSVSTLVQQPHIVADFSLFPILCGHD